MAIPFVHVQAKGTHRELGRAVGEAARERVQASVDFFRADFATMTHGRLTFEEAERQTPAYRAGGQTLAAAVRGGARGSRRGLRRAVLAAARPQLRRGVHLGRARRLRPRAGRRTPATTARPWPWSPAAATSWGTTWTGTWSTPPTTSSSTSRCPDGTRVMGLAGAPYLLMLGMNSHGIGNVSNSVHSTDNRIGVPNVFVRRSTLEARTLEEARERGLLAARARGTNQFFADTGGRLWDLETSATAHALMDHTPAGFMAHSNHYVSPEMQAYEGYGGGESEVRLTTAERLLAEGLAAGEDPVDLVARVLRTHEPSLEDCICGHPEPDLPPGDQGMTVGSLQSATSTSAACTPAPGRRARTRTRCSRWGAHERPRPRRQPAAASSTAAATPGTAATWPSRGDRIAAIGAPGTLRGRRVIDAADRYVTPGFIDPHTHSDLTILVHPHAETAVRQGVTTHVTGNCGMSAAPLTEKHRDDAVHNWGALRLGPRGGRLGLAHLRPVSRRPAAARPGHQHRAARRPRRLAAGGGRVRGARRHRARAGAHGAAAGRQPCAPARTACPAASSTRPGCFAEHRRARAPVPRRRAPPRHLHVARARRARDDPARRWPRRSSSGARPAWPVEVSHNAPKWGAPEDAAANLGAHRGGAPRRPGRDHRQRRAHRPRAAVLAGAAAAGARPRARRGSSRCSRTGEARAALRREVLEDALPGAGYAGLVRHGRFERIVVLPRRPPPGAARPLRRRHRRGARRRPLRHVPRPHRGGGRRHRRALRLHRGEEHPGAAAEPARRWSARTGCVMAPPGRAGRPVALLAVQLRGVPGRARALRARGAGAAPRGGHPQDDLLPGAALPPLRPRGPPARPQGRPRRVRPRPRARPRHQPVPARVPVREHPARLTRRASTSSSSTGSPCSTRARSPGSCPAACSSAPDARPHARSSPACTKRSASASAVTLDLYLDTV